MRGQRRRRVRKGSQGKLGTLQQGRTSWLSAPLVWLVSPGAVARCAVHPFKSHWGKRVEQFAPAATPAARTCCERAQDAQVSVNFVLQLQHLHRAAAQPLHLRTRGHTRQGSGAQCNMVETPHTTHPLILLHVHKRTRQGSGAQCDMGGDAPTLTPHSTHPLILLHVHERGGHILQLRLHRLQALRTGQGCARLHARVHVRALCSCTRVHVPCRHACIHA